MSCTTELLYPHTQITPEIIMEFFNARAPPNVPATHPRANDPFFTGENLRPFVHREGNFIRIYPADERPMLEIDVMRSLGEIMDEVSAFNQQLPFPSFPDPYSPAELMRMADEAFPMCEYRAADDDENMWDPWAFNLLAIGGGLGEDIRRAVEEDMDAFNPDPTTTNHNTAPAGYGAQWHATPTTVSGRPTPLPLYASPDLLPEESEVANEASGSGTQVVAQPGPAPDASLLVNHPDATQAPRHSQPVEDAPLPGNDDPVSSASGHIQPAHDAPLPDDDDPAGNAPRHIEPVQDAPIPNDDHPIAPAPRHIQHVEDLSRPDGIYAQAPYHTQPTHDVPFPNNYYAPQAPPHSQPAPAINSRASTAPATQAMMPASQFTFHNYEGPSTGAATFVNYTAAPAPGVGPTVSNFRAFFFSAKEYTGPPEKSARKTPAAKSKGKAARKAARK